MKAQGLRTSVVLSKTRGSVPSIHAAVYNPITPTPSTPLLMSMDTKHVQTVTYMYAGKTLMHKTK